MNQEIKKEWVEALRSGEYKQGTHMLRSKNNEFCCLGVLCDIYSKKCKDIEWDEGSANPCYKFSGYNSSLPMKIQDWSELNSEFGAGIKVEPEFSKKVLGFYANVAYLSTLNDSGIDFNQIADLIEQQL